MCADNNGIIADPYRPLHRVCWMGIRLLPDEPHRSSAVSDNWVADVKRKDKVTVFYR